MKRIQYFISAVKRRLNFQLVLSELINSLLVMSCCMLPVCLLFIFRGYRVELKYLAFPALIAGIFFAARYAARRYSYSRAAEYADRHFAMCDALVSAIDFNRKGGDDGFHRLHFAKTQSQCSEQNPQLITITVPWLKTVLSVVLLLSVAFLARLDDSPEVTGRRQQEALIGEVTDGINRQLKKEIENLRQKLTPEEKKLVEKSGLAEYLKNLESRKEMKDAMRQYAQFEHEIDRMAQPEKIARNERLLREIAKQLLRNRDTRRLGEMFERGEYKAAARELRNCKFAESFSGEKFAQLKKTLSEMREASDNQPGNDSRIRQDIKALDKAVENLDKAMRKAGEQGRNSRECPECESCRQQADKNLEQMCDNLSRQQTAKDFMEKMRRLRDAMRGAQDKLRQECGGRCPGNGKQPGGQPGKRGEGQGQGDGVGTGAAGNFNNTENTGMPDGYMTRVSGVKNSGPSLKEIEEAGGGSGISRRAKKISSTEFKYRMEEFINRGDVPDSMKSGVKKYFSIIHDNQ